MCVPWKEGCYFLLLHRILAEELVSVCLLRSLCIHTKILLMGADGFEALSLGNGTC